MEQLPAEVFTALVVAVEYALARRDRARPRAALSPEVRAKLAMVAAERRR